MYRLKVKRLMLKKKLMLLTTLLTLHQLLLKRSSILFDKSNNLTRFLGFKLITGL
jgi:hypothetical protein